MFNRTLLLHQGALGDLFLSLPAIYAIRYGSDADALHLISRTDLHELLLSNGLIDRGLSIDSGFLAPLFGEDSLPEALKDFLAGYGSAFIFSRSPDLSVVERVARHIPRSHHIKTVPPAGEVIHVSDYQLRGVGATGIGSAVAMPVLNAGSSFAGPAYRSSIVLHPGSGGRGKCWPLEYYLELAATLLNSGGCRICFLTGPAEGEDIVQLLAGGMDRRGVTADIVRDRPISDIASLLKSSALYIGNDSGVTHLASALGVPTVALFGPTDHRLWRPQGKQTRVVRSGIPCSPCREERYRRCDKRNCLETIVVDSVMEQIIGLIGDRTGIHGLVPGSVV